MKKLPKATDLGLVNNSFTVSLIRSNFISSRQGLVINTTLFSAKIASMHFMHCQEQRGLSCSVSAVSLNRIKGLLPWFDNSKSGRNKNSSIRSRFQVNFLQTHLQQVKMLVWFGGTWAEVTYFWRNPEGRGCLRKAHSVLELSIVVCGLHETAKCSRNKRIRFPQKFFNAWNT